jgi:site-specific recombinase XerD
MDIDLATQKFYDYSINFKGLSKKTILRYKYSINFYKAFAGITSLDQITSSNISALFFHGRTERNWSVNTFLVFHKSLSKFFQWCVSQGYMETNPVKDIETGCPATT